MGVVFGVLLTFCVLVWMFRVEINSAKAREAAERIEKKLDAKLKEK